MVPREPAGGRPDRLSDPVWGAGYDFGLEAEVAAALRTA